MIIRICLIVFQVLEILGTSTEYINEVSVARMSEGTIVLKEIIVIFIVLRDHVWGFGMVHRFVREVTPMNDLG